MTTVRDRNQLAAHGLTSPGPQTDHLRRELQQLGLRPYGARVLLALLRAGSANSAELAELSGVPRTSIYQVMEALVEQGLADVVPTTGPTVWACESWEAVVDALDAAGQERLRQHHARTRRLRQDLAQMLARTPPLSA